MHSLPIRRLIDRNNDGSLIAPCTRSATVPGQSVDRHVYARAACELPALNDVIERIARAQSVDLPLRRAAYRHPPSRLRTQCTFRASVGKMLQAALASILRTTACNARPAACASLGIVLAYRT